DGWREAIAHTSRWPGQSILYAVVTSFFCVGSPPLRDILMRTPSLLGSLVALFLLYRFAERIAGEGAGVVATAVFITHPSMIRIAVGARPYALAIAACIASFYCFYEWLQTGSRRYWMLYLAASVAVIYLHYLFAFIFFVQFLYLLLDGSVRRTASWGKVAISAAVLAASTLPLWPALVLLVKNAHTLPFAGRPSPDQFITALIPLTSIFAATLAWLYIELRSQPGFPRDERRDRSGLILIIVWWLVGPLFFYGASTLSRMTVFVERYIAFAIPATCLLIAWGAVRIFPAKQLRQWLWIMAAILVLNPPMLARFFRPGAEEYGPAIRIINSLADRERVPVFVRSPLIESNYQNWKAGATKDSYLFAPIAAYPITGEMIPLPNILDDDARTYIQTTVAGKLAGADRILMLGHWDDVMLPWILEYLKERGYEVREWNPNSIAALEFRKH
ncbi:MAG TPA: glycosyltransferase family 39 protein, partial [Bryobacteraceae bacterium]|nr:glycosyltransferase family 39 protein [Bryobacteraceae bacterium]